LSSAVLSEATFSDFLNNNIARRSDIDHRYMMLGFRIFLEFGAIIAAPVVLLAWLGKYLDGRYGTGPKLLIVGFVLAFVISAISLTNKAKKFGQEYEAIGKKKEVDQK
jgi:hypothetical protein